MTAQGKATPTRAPFYDAVKGLMLALYEEQAAPQPIKEERVGEQALVSVA